MPFDFIFSLDDDSCFVDTDSPAQAIEYMENHPKVAVLSFPLVSSFNPPPIHHTSPYPCLSYAACAALIRQSAFLEVGGYYSDFFYYGEEPELGHMAFGLHNFLSYPCTYFTLLREPTEREPFPQFNC